MKDKWIDIKDKLPMKGQKVLIAILHKYSNVPWEYSITMSIFVDIETWGAPEGNFFMKPTHWMPLPKPPKIPFQKKQLTEKVED